METLTQTCKCSCHQQIGFDQYQQLAHSTAIYPKDLKILYPALGLSGEVGEINEKIKKVFRDNGGIFDDQAKAQLKKELGDAMWYIAELATCFDFRLQDVAQANIDKLSDRKKRGVLSGSGDER